MIALTDLQRCWVNHTTEPIGRIGKTLSLLLSRKDADPLINRKGKGLPAGEEDLGSDTEFVLSFFRNHKHVADPSVDSVEVQSMLDRPAQHAINVVNAMKAYSWLERRRNAVVDMNSEFTNLGMQSCFRASWMAFTYVNGSAHFLDKGLRWEIPIMPLIITPWIFSWAEGLRKMRSRTHVWQIASQVISSLCVRLMHVCLNPFGASLQWRRGSTIDKQVTDLNHSAAIYQNSPRLCYLRSGSIA